MQFHFDAMQFSVSVFNIAPELPSIELPLFKLVIDSVDLVRHRKEIATKWRLGPVIAKQPANVPSHPIEVVDFVSQPMRPGPCECGSKIVLPGVPLCVVARRRRNSRETETTSNQCD